MKVFNELLAIKRFREDQAELALARARAQVTEAEQELHAAKDELERFMRWMLERELGMYDAMCGELVQVRDIELVLSEVATMRQNAEQHRELLAQADARLKELAEALLARREELNQANRMVEKFLELARQNDVELAQAAERAEDLEMEEAAASRRDHDDWSEHTEYEP